jgi:hypothetical protein
MRDFQILFFSSNTNQLSELNKSKKDFVSREYNASPTSKIKDIDGNIDMHKIKTGGLNSTEKHKVEKGGMNSTGSGTIISEAEDVHVFEDGEKGGFFNKDVLVSSYTSCVSIVLLYRFIDLFLIIVVYSLV